jgi:phospholipase A1
MTPYRPNYFLPLTLNSSLDDTRIRDPGRGGEDDPAEAKFQISLEFEVWRNMFDRPIDLYFAFTQVAWWQLYNADASSPFREVNYEPELGAILYPQQEWLGLHFRQLRFGVVHQSNGRSGSLSRSWNRAYATLLVDQGRFAAALRLWARIPEDEDDDNPDIEDYYGHFELYGFYKWRQHTLGLMLRNNLRREHNRGALQLDWSYPISDRLKFYVQYFNGYGESLIDYRDSVNRLGLGLMLTDWL